MRVCLWCFFILSLVLFHVSVCAFAFAFRMKNNNKERIRERERERERDAYRYVLFFKRERIILNHLRYTNYCANYSSYLLRLK